MPERGPIRVLVVDDEPLARACVVDALAGVADIDIVGEAADGEAAVDAIATLEPDLVLLDVQMPGIDGFGVLERVGAGAVPALVFVTAHDEHALRAFDVHALDYVLKPFEDARLVAAVQRARLWLGRRESLGEQVASLLDAVGRGGAGGPRPMRRLAVRDDDAIHFVKAGDIDWIEADGNRIRIHAGGRVFAQRATLAGTLARLDPEVFARIHRSTVVNVDRIRELRAWFGGDYLAVLEDGTELKVSRSYRDELLARD